MLTQYVLMLRPSRPLRPRSEWAYHLYAALLAGAPAGFGKIVHQDGATPVSQYLREQDGQLLWTVSLLGQAGEAALGPVVEGLETLAIRREGITFTVEERQRRTVADVDGLFAPVGQVHTLRFHTPAAFKSQGQYINLPTPRLFVGSLVKKWNGCITECPIEDEDGAGLDALAQGLYCAAFQLQNQSWHLKGNAIPGFVGTLTLENRLTGFHRELANALLCFASYAGVGIKTALGMGGVERLAGHGGQ